MHRHSAFLSILLVTLSFAAVSCSKYADYDGVYEAEMPAMKGEYHPNGSGGGGNTSAGVLTAGEWRDLDDWPFWGALMRGKDFQSYSAYWGFFTNNRIPVTVTCGGVPAVNVRVELRRAGKTIWKSRTDNHGRADCWLGLNQMEEQFDTLQLSLVVAGVVSDKPVMVSGWDSKDPAQPNVFDIKESSAPGLDADIAFIVDATGSMGDEISFLKEDLADIIKKVSALKTEVAIRTGAVFYRDEGDDYLTRVSGLSGNFKETGDFIAKQNADGGGDYPEAVHTALEDALQKLSWNESARSRLAFLFLDAPAHNNKAVIASLQDSIELYAAMGIRIIPVAASGVDKATEMMSRFFAITTGGTYVFLTDHSGVGESHIEASVGQYKVEQLNELIVRLITQYIE